MSEDTEKGTLDFARSQLDLVKQQLRAVNQDDLITAQAIGNQLKRSIPSLARIIKQCREDEIESETSDELVNIAEEIQQLQDETAAKLEEDHERLAHLLQEIRNGRQMLARYRTSPPAAKTIFDMRG